MRELPLLFDGGFGGTETCPCSQGLGWVCSLTPVCTYPLHAPLCPLGHGQDPVSEVLGSDPLSSTPYLFQALFPLLWECGSCVKAEKQYQQPATGQGFPCTVGCGSAVLYLVTGRSKFCISEPPFVLAGAGRAEELLAAGLHIWTCACSAAWLLATASAALCCPEGFSSLCHTGMGGSRALPLHAAGQHCPSGSALSCIVTAALPLWLEGTQLGPAGRLWILLVFLFLCFISFPSSHFSV